VSVGRARSSIPALLAAVALLAACEQGGSILLVEVAGDLTLMPAQLSVAVTAGGIDHPPFRVPPAPTVISLPTSFTVELDRSITGAVTIAIDALDGYGYVVASGTTTQSHIASGGQTIIVVTLGTP
jgi:hypothetical protein